MVHIIENPDTPSVAAHHTAFEVDDTEAACAALLTNRIATANIQNRNGGQRTFCLNDLDGNRVEICTKSGFGALV